MDQDRITNAAQSLKTAALKINAVDGGPATAAQMLYLAAEMIGTECATPPQSREFARLHAQVVAKKITKTAS